MDCDVATAITLKDLHAELRELFARCNHVGSFRVSSQGYNGSVFEQQQNIADETVFAKLGESLLQA